MEPNSCSSSGNTSATYTEDSLTRRRKSRERNSGNITAKSTLLSWLIDAGVVEENVLVFSVDEVTKFIVKNGKIKRGGIDCLCCNKLFTVAGFHLHGGRNCCKPYESITVAETKVSLLSYMIQAWNSNHESSLRKVNAIQTTINTSDIYDDTCIVCADGGDLMCCDKCSSTYHPTCMGMKDVPEDSRYCPYCVCKFCGKPAHANDHLLSFPQCDKGYHWECHQMKEQRGMDLNVAPIAPFCDRSCSELSETLREIVVGKRHELDEGYTWSLLHRTEDDCNGVYMEDRYTKAVCRAKLGVVRVLMEDCFETIQDRYTEIKIIPSVVYNCGSNFRRIDFRVFYTVVLEKDEEFFSVASLRIHGTKLAEMPFIGTSESHREKGCAQE